MTYPDARVSDVLAHFVCIRVDCDREPELRTRHGAKGLPDLRFLDADGRELVKLLGFQSPERLSKEAQRVLDQLAGKSTSESPVVVTKREVAVTETTVTEAVRRGCEFLAREAIQDSAARGGIAGLDDLALFALVSAGRKAGDSTVDALLARSLAAKHTGTYQVALQALALARLDAAGHRQQLTACARFLTSTQLVTGLWSYGDDPSARGDNSNSAYALLGLWACGHAGIEVPRPAFARAGSAWRASQNADGGWGYGQDREVESYASMTESGLAALLLCRDLGAAEAADDRAVERARTWLASNFAVDSNRGSAYQQGRLLYHLYALERAGTLLGSTRIGEHDWHTEGAAYLLGTQRDDGAWDDGADTPVANTAFALLFLTRATRAR